MNCNLDLLMDGLLGLGMGVERAERDTIRRPPYRPTESDAQALFATIVFTSLALTQLARALASTSFVESIRRMGLRGNRAFRRRTIRRQGQGQGQGQVQPQLLTQPS